MSIEEYNAKFQGLAKCMKHLYGFFDGVAIRCALELNIADIINNHEGPISLAKIASEIGSSSLSINGLSRLMTFLVHKQIVDQVHHGDQEPLYALNTCSKWLLQDLKTTIAPLAILATDPSRISPFYNISKSISEGGTTMEKTFGIDSWGFLAANPRVSKMFNDAMACRTRMTMDVVMANYRFDGLKGTLVDVAGGIGAAINEIVTAHPHLKGINFDSPHVVSTAPAYEGVTHVGGDMFKAIPPADSVFIKYYITGVTVNVFKYSKNCRDSTPAKTGKIVIVDIVLHPGGRDEFEDTRIALDLLMLASFKSGKERTEVDWKKMLEEAGIYRYNIIKMPALESIIEAYLD